MSHYCYIVDILLIYFTQHCLEIRSNLNYLKACCVLILENRSDFCYAEQMEI